MLYWYPFSRLWNVCYFSVRGDFSYNVFVQPHVIEILIVYHFKKEVYKSSEQQYNIQYTTCRECVHSTAFITMLNRPRKVWEQHKKGPIYKPWNFCFFLSLSLFSLFDELFQQSRFIISWKINTHVFSLRTNYKSWSTFPDYNHKNLFRTVILLILQL